MLNNLLNQLDAESIISFGIICFVAGATIIIRDWMKKVNQLKS